MSHGWEGTPPSQYEDAPPPPDSDSSPDPSPRPSAEFGSPMADAAAADAAAPSAAAAEPAAQHATASGGATLPPPRQVPGRRALWVPDSFSPKCLVRDCETPLKKGKRHHCRACGRNICDKCSVKAEVPQYRNKKVRCCKMCKIPNTPTLNFPEVYESLLTAWAVVTVVSEDGSEEKHRWHLRLLHPSYALGPAVAMCESSNEDMDYKPKHWIPVHNACKIERVGDEIVLSSYLAHFNVRLWVQTPATPDEWLEMLELAKAAQ